MRLKAHWPDAARRSETAPSRLLYDRVVCTVVMVALTPGVAVVS